MGTKRHAVAGALLGIGAAAGALIACAGQPAHAQDAGPAVGSRSSPAGEYVHSEMELVAGILLREDGTFEYGLTVGSLDERASGRWKAVDRRIELTSDPRPVAPTVTADRTDMTPGKPFGFRVLGPDGRDVPGVDFRVEFDRGDSLEGYTPGDTWFPPQDEERSVRFVTFSMPSYRLQSERLPLEARDGQTAIFKLTPNDFGVADLTGSFADLEGSTLTLHRPEGTMEFRRRGKD